MVLPKQGITKTSNGLFFFMISHAHRCIFIHIPKCAGTSVKYFLFPNEKIHWKEANYEVLHGWCPKRKFFMQHATAQQLLETELVTPEQWESYTKFTFVRNPWDRAVSDYFWLMKDQKIKDSFSHYLRRSGKFTKVLNEVSETYYRGEHLDPQSHFFDNDGPYALDYVGRFENFLEDMQQVLQLLHIDRPFETHINASKKKRKQYSRYYSDKNRDWVAQQYAQDLENFGYGFQDQRSRWDKLWLT